MPEYLTPGLYVEEVESGSKPIEGVGATTCAFIGYAKSGPFNQPIFITSWNQFCATFGEEETPLVGALSKTLQISPVEVAGMKADSRKSWLDFTSMTITDAVKESNPYKNSKGVPIKDLRQFCKDYDIPTDGSPYMEGSYLAHSVFGFYLNGGTTAYIVRAARESDIKVYENGTAEKVAAPAVKAIPPPSVAIGPMTFIGKETAAKGGDIAIDVEPVEGDEFRIKINQGRVNEVWPSKDGKMGAGGVKAALEASTLVDVEVKAGKLDVKPITVKLEFAQAPAAMSALVSVLDDAVPVISPVQGVVADDFIGDEDKRRGAMGLSVYDDINMICMPDLMAGVWKHKQVKIKKSVRVDGKDVIKDTYEDGEEMLNLTPARRQAILDMQCNLVAYCENKKDRMAIIDPLPGLDAQQMRDAALDTPWNCDKGQAALYYPWIKVSDPIRKGKQLLVPPSGHIAGVWARVVNERGVHKAPANEFLRGAVALEKYVTPGEQGILNPEGVNAIRSFPGEGIKIYGARTLATRSNPEWKYVNVRRLFNFIEVSVRRGMTWAVFEPNDQDLWGRLRRNIGAFLNVCWREGMLFGETPAQAFFVKCDADTNPREMIDLGRVYVEVGISPVKPAEFVIIRMSQWDGGGDTSEG